VSLKLFLFGYPRLEHGGHSLPLKLRKGLALAAYLAMAGKPVGRDLLAELLWPEAPSGEGRASLRRTLHRLQRQLGIDLFVTTSETVALAPAVVASTDVVVFQSLLERHSSRAPAGQTMAELHQASSLYRDDFLLGFTLPECQDFADWQARVCEELRQGFGEALTQLAQAAAAGNDYEAALAYAQRRLTLDSLHEPTHRLLMRLHAEAGHPAAALYVYDECRVTLMRELGISPQKSTESLRRTIADGVYPTASVPTSEPTPVRYVVSDGVHVAYRLYGEGPLTLVVLPGFVSHLDFYWDQPELARFMQALGHMARVVCFDKRGVGLSDRIDYAATPQHTARDLLAILNAESIERVVLLGVSEGGPTALTLTATTPERVTALVLYGTLARALRTPDYPWGYPPERYDAQVEALINDWGGPACIESFAPGWALDVERRAWWARALRLAASPRTVKQVFEALKSIDVRPLLARIDCPTLILHRHGDKAVPVEHGRFLARQIPHAQWVELPGEDHWWWVGDTRDILRHLDEFLASLRHS
jgi:DNA-binding SARP family transcriptional activator/pimeloyl-ACP methyl ester carboxylesterase